MKGLILTILLCLPAHADIVPHPRPYRVTAKVPWSRIPYPQCPIQSLQKDGSVFTIRNPLGVACQPQYDSSTWFRCYMVVDTLLQEILITGGEECEPLWETQW